MKRPTGLKTGLAGLKPPEVQSTPVQNKQSIHLQGTSFQDSGREKSPDFTLHGTPAPIVTRQEMNKAAATIQKVARGHQVRKQMPQRKQQHQRELTKLGGGTRYMGMASESATQLMQGGFAKRPTYDPLDVDGNSRNGKGLYLSADVAIAESFAAQNSPTGKGKVMVFQDLDLRGLNSIRHPGGKPEKKHRFTVDGETGVKEFEKDSTSMYDRQDARKAIVKKEFGNDKERVDYVTGVTQGMGRKKETILFSEAAIKRLNTAKRSIMPDDE